MDRLNEKPLVAVLVLPFLVIMGLFLFWPLVILAQRSLLTGQGGTFSWALYQEVLTSSSFIQSLISTALISVLSTILALLICIPAAIYIEGKGGRGRKWLAVALTIPLSLPGIVIGFFVILNFGLTGMVPRLIQMVTGTRELTIAYTFWGMLLGYLYFQIPRVILVMRGAISAISQDSIDVARTLGASTFRVYLEVILPALRLAIISASSLSLATGFGAFGTAATLSRGFRVVPLEIAAAFTENFQPALAGAMSLLLVLTTTTILFGIGSLGEPRSRGRQVAAREAQ
jgi:putative spermidine/putrescine transport system permease protein